MNVQSNAVKSAGDRLASAIGSVAGAVADPKGGVKQLKSAMSSPKPLAVAPASPPRTSSAGAAAAGARHGEGRGRPGARTADLNRRRT